MSHIDKIVELSFFAEMESLAETESHESEFRGLDKIAKRRTCNPIVNLRKGKKSKAKGLERYFNRAGKQKRQVIA